MFLRDVWSYSPDSPPPPRSASLRLGHCTQYCSLGTVCRALTTHSSHSRSSHGPELSASLLHLLHCCICFFVLCMADFATPREDGFVQGPSGGSSSRPPKQRSGDFETPRGGGGASMALNSARSQCVPSSLVYSTSGCYPLIS